MSDKTIETTRQIGPSQAITGLKHCIALKRPVMIWGAPGIGKSDIVKQIGDEQSREVIDIRLPLWEPTDIKGIPFYNSTTNKMEWAPPIELPSDPKSQQFYSWMRSMRHLRLCRQRHINLSLTGRWVLTICLRVCQLWRLVTEKQTEV